MSDGNFRLFTGMRHDLPLTTPRLVELTGEPGDMVFCHPVMVHCGAPNRSARPRFMRTKQQFLTHEGRALFRNLTASATPSRPT